jgi:hypothetical protein
MWLTCHLAAPILAGSGLVSLSICDCWLPLWLPAIRPPSSLLIRDAGSQRSAGHVGCFTGQSLLVFAQRSRAQREVPLVPVVVVSPARQALHTASGTLTPAVPGRLAGSLCWSIES